MEFLGEKVRVTSKQLISALSRSMVNNYPMSKINQFITPRISKSLKRSRFYRDLSVDLCSERDVKTLFILGHCGCYLLYNAIITRTKIQQELTSQREKLLSAILFCQRLQHACESLRSLHCVDAFCCQILLLNQLMAGDVFTNYSYGCWVWL